MSLQVDIDTGTVNSMVVEAVRAMGMLLLGITGSWGKTIDKYFLEGTLLYAPLFLINHSFSPSLMGATIVFVFWPKTQQQNLFQEDFTTY